MTKYREILRLHSQGISNRIIATSLNCSRNTVRIVLERAIELSFLWPIPDSMSERALEEALFQKRPISLKCKAPDFEYIHKELAKNGVTLSLLWNEYCEQCRMESSRPLMYSQFCHHYQQFAVQNKATLHIVYKPGERMEVD
jgi:transposase